MGDAVKLARDADFPGALAVYDELLGRLDADILHLNRGRVLQKMGRCWDARAAYDRADQAPHDPTIERKAFDTRLERYNDELEGSCRGRVVVACDLPETRILYGGKELACDGTEIEYDAGKHQIHGLIFGEPLLAEVTVRGTRTAKVELNPTPRQRLGIGRALLNLNQAERARRMLERVIRDNESQEAYLYIAETLIQLERCQAAAAALEDAPGAPPSASLSRVEFESRLSDLQDAFHDDCGERVLLKCSPGAVNLRIDSGSRIVCSPAPIYLSIGPHTVVAQPAEPSDATRASLRRDFVVEAGKANTVVLDLQRPETITSTGVWGIVASTLGVGLVAGAVVLDISVIGPEIEKYDEANRTFSGASKLQAQANRIETLQIVDISMFVVGGALVATGATLLLYDLLGWDEDASGGETTWAPSVGMHKDGGYVGLEFDF